MDREHPKLIIVTGRPATGKSTLAKRLSQEIKIPIVSKDNIREILFERLGWKDRTWAQLLGRASIDMMFYFAQAELSVGRSIILDNAFDPKISNQRFQKLLAEQNSESIQIICNSDSNTLFQRFKLRAETSNRHPGHGDENVLEQLRTNLAKEESPMLDIIGDVVEVDTTDFEKIDFPEILKRVRIFLDK